MLRLSFPALPETTPAHAGTPFVPANRFRHKLLMRQQKWGSRVRGKGSVSKFPVRQNNVVPAKAGTQFFMSSRFV
jgi:hypothetical protein